ncbi:MAG: HAD family hydrolase [Actinomycetota bacterium]|nr:HAD family hydrolase [Actinomycetota bacterium]
MTDHLLDSVLLDVDGTLIDSSYFHALAWRRAFAQHELAIPMWRLHRAIGMGGDRLVAAVAGDQVEARLGDALRDGWQREYDKLLPEVSAFDGAGALLTELRERGWRVGLATSGKPDHTRAAIELLGGQEQVDGWTSADDAEDSKPAPDILRAALDEIGGQAAVCVGDSTYDIEAAAALGWQCIGIRTGGFGAAELQEAGAIQVFEDVAELLENLDGTRLAQPDQQ